MSAHAATVRLDPASIEALADALVERLLEPVATRVAEILRDDQAPQLVDAARLAQILGVSRDTVYAHAAELGALEVGDGTRPRLRFDVATAREAWTARSRAVRSEAAESPVATGDPTPRRRGRKTSSAHSVPLLPIGGTDV